jgi:hypothetical protein
MPACREVPSMPPACHWVPNVPPACCPGTHLPRTTFVLFCSSTGCQPGPVAAARSEHMARGTRLVLIKCRSSIRKEKLPNRLQYLKPNWSVSQLHTLLLLGQMSSAETRWRRRLAERRLTGRIYISDQMLKPRPITRSLHVWKIVQKFEPTSEVPQFQPPF